MLRLHDVPLPEAAPMGQRGFYSDKENLLLPGFLADPEIELLRSKVLAQRDEHVITRGGKDYRRAAIYWLSPEDQRSSCAGIVRKILEGFERAEAHFGYELECLSPRSLQVANYKAGGLYDWHVDSLKGEGFIRLLTMVVELSDPRSYKGGGFEYRLNQESKDGRFLRIERGTAMFMPSNRPHRAVLVEEGERQSLVAWAVGRLDRNVEPKPA